MSGRSRRSLGRRSGTAARGATRGPCARITRPAGAWLGIFALLIQVWLPLVHHPALAAAGAPPAYAGDTALFGGEIALCLAPLSGQPDPSGRPVPVHKIPVCPICQAMHALGSFVPPAGIVVAERPLPPVPVNAAHRVAVIARAANPATRPRAPPVPA